MRVGLDVGSTTIKCVVLDDRNNLIYHTYERHYSHIVEKSAELLRRVAERCGSGHLRLCRHGHGGERKGSLCAGGVRYPGGGQPSGTGDGRYHRIGRRGCQDPLSDQRYGGPDERLLRRRHRGLHRPDGHAAENGRGGDGQSRPDSGKDLHHRRPLRRVCQERHPAPHQSGGQIRRHRQEHLPGGGEPDHRRPGPGAAHQGTRPVSGRPPDLLQVPAAEL